MSDLKAQETLDAELLALAALVAHDAAMVNAQMSRYGALMTAPDDEAANRLRELLEQRGVLTGGPHE